MRITRRGFEITDPCPEVRRAIVRDLTVSPLDFQSTFPKSFRVFLEDVVDVDVKKKTYVVPAFWARDTGLRGPDERRPGTSIDVEFEGTLREDLSQPRAARAILDSLRECGGAVCNMHAGGGKTVVALHVAATLGKKCMILVHKEFLRNQWTERIRQYVPGASVTVVQGPAMDVSGDFVIASIQTILSRRYGHDAFRDVGFLVVDECHHLGAAAFSQVMLRLAVPKVLGLSATLVRRDGLSRVIHWFCGPVAFSSQRTGHSNVRVRVVKFSHSKFRDPPPLNRRGDLCYASFMTILTQIEERTALVAAEARALASSGRRTLVLSHRRSHATAIRDALVALDVDAATYLGGDKAPPECAVTCATYALVAEGYDDSRLSALVLSTPSSDVVQAVGRVMRGGEFSDPVIVDVLDDFGMCFAQFAKRKRYYKATGFTFVDGDDDAGAHGDDDARLDENAFVDDDDDD